jgi:hypothetical protein
MADSLRDQDTSAASAGRESRIEELLLAGLDHYFSGQHELAISVWTRVLFLDRSHARARAYIERARGAIAERHAKGKSCCRPAPPRSAAAMPTTPAGC